MATQFGTCRTPMARHPNKTHGQANAILPMLAKLAAILIVGYWAPASKAADADSEHYTLIMSRDHSLCSHMLNLVNEDLRRYGWNWDRRQKEHEEFKRVPWRPAQFSTEQEGGTEYVAAKGASFDFNNDGNNEFVVLYTGSLRNQLVDMLIILDSNSAARANELTAREFLTANNKIYLATGGYQLKTKPNIHIRFEILSPFIYKTKSYLLMQQLSGIRHERSDYAVIADYHDGLFVPREPIGRMDDVCYFKRISKNRSKY